MRKGETSVGFLLFADGGGDGRETCQGSRGGVWNLLAGGTGWTGILQAQSAPGIHAVSSRSIPCIGGIDERLGTKGT